MGRGKHVTIDEWFYFWFADDEKMPTALAIFEKMFDVCDKIVIQRKSRLAKRFYELFEQSSMYPPVNREIIKSIMRKWITNPLKIYWVEEVEEIPLEILDKLPAEDIYIIKICIATTDRIFVTTDNKLHANLLETKADLGITPYIIQDFIKLYPNI